MPQKLKELEEFENKALSTLGSIINLKTFQSFMDMEKVIIKENNKEKKKEKLFENKP